MVDDSTWTSESGATHFLELMWNSRPFITEQFEIMLRLIPDLGVPVRRFMDLGCGDGALVAVIWQQYPAATGVGVDHSPLALQAAREKFHILTAPIHLCDIDYGQSV